jgi:hypothetical protein
LVQAVDRQGIEGSIAAITAGWQEREAEDQELRDHLGRRVINLRLHHRAEQVFAEDPPLFAAHRRRQDRLRSLLRLYRYRLDFTIQPAREIRSPSSAADLLSEEKRLALEALRQLDASYLSRVAAEHQSFESEMQPLRRAAVIRHRDEIRQVLADAQAVAVAGGHVAVLLNRLRLFGLADLMAGKAIFAWSAGAMALAPRVVLFHDHPPQGAGNAEVLEHGLGLFPDLVPLPHAQYRLRLDDPKRVALFARRFAPATCVPLDAGACLTWSGEAWQPSPGTLYLDRNGETLAMETA